MRKRKLFSILQTNPDIAKIYKLYSDGVYVSDLMQMFDAARPTIYKVIKETKEMMALSKETSS